MLQVKNVTLLEEHLQQLIFISLLTFSTSSQTTSGPMWTFTDPSVFMTSLFSAFAILLFSLTDIMDDIVTCNNMQHALDIIISYLTYVLFQFFRIFGSVDKLKFSLIHSIYEIPVWKPHLNLNKSMVWYIYWIWKTKGMSKFCIEIFCENPFFSKKANMTWCFKILPQL